jgi:hypothetical protein
VLLWAKAATGQQTIIPITNSSLVLCAAQVANPHDMLLWAKAATGQQVGIPVTIIHRFCCFSLAGCQLATSAAAGKSSAASRQASQ